MESCKFRGETSFARSIFRPPKNIIKRLQTGGYTIPQTYYDDLPHNVVCGELSRKGQFDWAVLCSKNQISSIMVFWEGSERNVSEIAKCPDKLSLQGIGNGKIGYSRQISIVTKQFILDHYKAYGGPEPPPIEHAGINDAFVGKASVVHYFYHGKWMKLTGAD